MLPWLVTKFFVSLILLHFSVAVELVRGASSPQVTFAIILANSVAAEM